MAVALRCRGGAEDLEQRLRIEDLGGLPRERAERRILLVALLQLLDCLAQRVGGALVEVAGLRLQLSAIASRRACSSAADRGRFSRSFASAHITSSDSAGGTSG